LDNGEHTLQTKAYDAAGNWEISSIVIVQVSNAGDTTPLTVSITFPEDGSCVQKNSSVIITADASDNVGVTKVEFLINNRLKCADTVSPYVCKWKVLGKPGVIYNLSAIAYDEAGNTASYSIQVTLPADTDPGKPEKPEKPGKGKKVALENIEDQLALISQTILHLNAAINELGM
jgi:hypothetical protein